jgi:pimeloyl-ACP methyl ester carboxylesterase
MPMVSVNGAEIYYEVRGSGPPVLLVMGATGDGGHFDTLADLLADEFTLITYDRRGNGRSPAPAGWTTTSAEEQADDAAALVDSLAVGPLAVFGTSSGGNFALWMLTRHPVIVRGAVLHEPGVYAVLDDFDAVRAPLHEEAVEAFHFEELSSEVAVEGLDEWILQRCTWFDVAGAGVVVAGW